MKKGYIAIGLGMTMLLLGAGCSSSQPAGRSDVGVPMQAEGDRYLLEETWGAFYQAAQNGEAELMQMLLWDPQTPEQYENMIPTVLDGSLVIDWEKSAFSDGGNEVRLVAEDGREIGIWRKDKDAWMLRVPFWE